MPSEESEPREVRQRLHQLAKRPIDAVFNDEAVSGEEIVRPFMVTSGRTRPSQAHELALETMVEPAIPSALPVDRMKFERKAIVTSLEGPTSIAEISADLHLPLLSTQVLVSDLVSDGVLVAHGSIDALDFGGLESIRAAIVNL